jgi:hypothetical protein
VNIFVLSTGRCGTKTFFEACRFMTNYTAAHESGNRLGKADSPPYASFRYPQRHIEVDNRLAWFLGHLEREYGDAAFYVHLLRRPEEVARSYLNRGRESILFAFASAVLQYWEHAADLDEDERLRVGLLYCETVNRNIELFLRGKTRQLTMWLHEAKEPFAALWERIGAEGDLEAALAAWDVRHNAADSGQAGAWAAEARSRA